ncbi:exodeoxyribonuclease V subunit alpha [Ahniella affigens]|nr:exodeoxyribonuclease V subunit alpha [Ahniella affigens]
MIAKRPFLQSADQDDAVALAFAAFVQATNPDPGLVGAAFLAARAEQQGDIGVDVGALEGEQVHLPSLGQDLDLRACLDAVPADHPWLVRDLGDRLYLRRQHAQETRVASALAARLSAPPTPLAPAADTWLQQTAASLDAFSRVQLDAARAAAQSSLFVLAGGPGTGKTRSIARIRMTLLRLGPNQRVLLAAPTGKAAQRLRDSLKQLAPLDPDTAALPIQATTVHRLLQQTSTLELADALIIDEASMLDLALLDRLLCLLPMHTRLILVGDPDQLASVEAGRVLADLIEHLAEYDPGQHQHRRLRHNFRAEASLQPLANAVLEGDVQAFRDALEVPLSPATCVEMADAEALQQWLGRSLAARLQSGAVWNRDLGLLCALRRGRFGAEGLNAWLSSSWPSWPSADAGEPILLTEHADEMDLWNGDLGWLRSEAGVQYFEIGNRRLPASLLPRHEPGFALTVHKAQGSEFDTVVLVLPNRVSPILSRELLYTGITRARKQVVLVGSAAVLEAALGKPRVRSSGLYARLRLNAQVPGAKVAP